MKIPNVGANNLYSPSTVRRSQGAPREAGFEMQVQKQSVAGRITDGLHQIGHSQRAADLKLERLASGEDVDIHGTMIALQEADITLRFAVSIRDKLLEGYQKIINMSI